LYDINLEEAAGCVAGLGVASASYFCNWIHWWCLD